MAILISLASAQWGPYHAWAQKQGILFLRHPRYACMLERARRSNTSAAQAHAMAHYLPVLAA